MQQNKSLDLSNLQEYFSKYKYIVGIDEAGRGSWAGPVQVSSYRLTKETVIHLGVNDSKQISKINRKKLLSVLTEFPDNFLTISKSNFIIDKIGINLSIEESINEIITKFDSASTLFIVDGKFKNINKGNLLQINKADSIYYPVAAASIISKQSRDNIMQQLHIQFPEYGWDTNSAYGTKKHRQALEEFGLTKYHRLTYKPMSENFNLQTRQ